MDSRPEPIQLTIPVKWLTAVILRLGLFELTTVLIILGFFAKAIWDFDHGSCNPPRTYFYTGSYLLSMVLLYLALSTIQASALILTYSPVAGMSRSMPLRLLTCRTLAKGLPFLIMLSSTVTLPEYHIVYLLAGMTLLVLWLFVALHFRRCRLRFPALRMSPAIRRRIIIASLNSVPILFFAATARPDPLFRGACWSPVSRTKSNMHTFQTAVETYAVDWGGIYSADPQILETEASTQGRSYWQDMSNPCSHRKGRTETAISLRQANLTKSVDFFGFRLDLKAGTSRCMVLYDVGPANGLPTRYWIYGTDSNARLIIDRNQIMVLTNN